MRKKVDFNFVVRGFAKPPKVPWVVRFLETSLEPILWFPAMNSKCFKENRFQRVFDRLFIEIADITGI